MGEKKSLKMFEFSKQWGCQAKIQHGDVHNEILAQLKSFKFLDIAFVIKMFKLC